MIPSEAGLLHVRVTILLLPAYMKKMSSYFLYRRWRGGCLFWFANFSPPPREMVRWEIQIPPPPLAVWKEALSSQGDWQLLIQAFLERGFWKRAFAQRFKLERG